MSIAPKADPCNVKSIKQRPTYRFHPTSTHEMSIQPNTHPRNVDYIKHPPRECRDFTKCRPSKRQFHKTSTHVLSIAQTSIHVSSNPPNTVMSWHWVSQQHQPYVVTTEVQVSILVYCKSEVGKGSGEWLGEGVGVIVMLGYVIFRQMDHCIRGEQWRDIAYMFIYQNHRRIINTEEKAKVVAAVWGIKFIHFLAELAILP